MLVCGLDGAEGGKLLNHPFLRLPLHEQAQGRFCQYFGRIRVLW